MKTTHKLCLISCVAYEPWGIYIKSRKNKPPICSRCTTCLNTQKVKYQILIDRPINISEPVEIASSLLAASALLYALRSASIGRHAPCTLDVQ